MYVAGLLMLLGSLATPVMAGEPTAAPEIDGSLMSTGLALLAGGILILRARRGAK